MMVSPANLIAGAERLLRTEQSLIQERRQAENLEHAVLKRRGGQQNFRAGSNAPFERPSRLVRGAMRIAQMMNFIDHHDVPVDSSQPLRATRRELAGADYRTLAIA